MEFYRNKSVLVTGASGFLGSHLVASLLHEGSKVSVISRKPVPGCQSFLIDISSKSGLERIQSSYEIIFHLAAMTSVPLCNKYPDKAVSANVDGTANMLDLAFRSGAKCFVFASSCSVYSFSPGPIPESGQTSPITVYGQTKLMAEKLCLQYANRFSVSIPRLFNVYGPGQQNDVTAIFMEHALKNRPITVEGDGTQKRDFLYITDAVQALLLMGQYSGLVNFGSGIGTGILSLAEKIISSCSSSSKILHSKGRQEEGDLVSSNSLALSLGWNPSVSLDRGLNQMLSSFKSRETI